MESDIQSILKDGIVQMTLLFHESKQFGGASSCDFWVPKS